MTSGRAIESVLREIGADANWAAPLCEWMPVYEINTPLRISAFIAQCSYESANFTRLEENMNYSWSRLRQVFPRYFPTDKLAREYDRDPERIANRVYDDSLRTNKLGNTEPGDGWRFRGRGIIQLTGRDNYQAFALSAGMSLEQVTQYVATPAGAVHSAAWFWKSKNINVAADAGDIDAVSVRVNGGKIGLAERRVLYHRIIKILTTATTQQSTPTPGVAGTLRLGSVGPGVVALQTALGIRADGVYNQTVVSAVKRYQAARGLVSDGIAGPATLRSLGILPLGISTNLDK